MSSPTVRSGEGEECQLCVIPDLNYERELDKVVHMHSSGWDGGERGARQQRHDYLRRTCNGLHCTSDTACTALPDMIHLRSAGFASYGQCCKRHRMYVVHVFSLCAQKNFGLGVLRAFPSQF